MNKNLLQQNNGAFVEVTVDGRAISPNVSDFEQFKQDYKWKYKTDEIMRAAYDRYVKCKKGILLTEDEFITEAGEYYDTETLKSVYVILAKLADQKKLRPGEIYQYAHFKWCLRNPDAIVAYEESTDHWRVNNCGEEITTEKAIICVNSEWGFEASRIKIIGKPYYEATDYQFIRFDCAYMTWLWQNGNLYQVY